VPGHAGLVKRVVVASSDKAYGAQPKLPTSKSMPLEGREPVRSVASRAPI
jgi:CDP-glucose 4,6-dehydratase